MIIFTLTSVHLFISTLSDSCLRREVKESIRSVQDLKGKHLTPKLWMTRKGFEVCLLMVPVKTASPLLRVRTVITDPCHQVESSRKSICVETLPLQPLSHEHFSVLLHVSRHLMVMHVTLLLMLYIIHGTQRCLVLFAVFMLYTKDQLIT